MLRIEGRYYISSSSCFRASLHRTIRKYSIRAEEAKGKAFIHTALYDDHRSDHPFSKMMDMGMYLKKCP